MICCEINFGCLLFLCDWNCFLVKWRLMCQNASTVGLVNWLATTVKKRKKERNIREYRFQQVENGEHSCDDIWWKCYELNAVQRRWAKRNKAMAYNEIQLYMWLQWWFIWLMISLLCYGILIVKSFFFFSSLFPSVKIYIYISFFNKNIMTKYFQEIWLRDGWRAIVCFRSNQMHRNLNLLAIFGWFGARWIRFVGNVEAIYERWWWRNATEFGRIRGFDFHLNVIARHNDGLGICNWVIGCCIAASFTRDRHLSHMILLCYFDGLR